MLLDFDYRLKILETKLNDIESNNQNNYSTLRLELGKTNEKNDRLEASNSNLRKLI